MRAHFLALTFLASSLLAQTPPPSPPAASPSAIPPIAINSELAGDAADGTVARLTFRYRIPDEVPLEAEVILQGSISAQGQVVRNFRVTLRPDERGEARLLETLPVGTYELEARLFIPFEDRAPIILAKGVVPLPITATNKTYVASADDGAAGAVAEGVVPEVTGAVRILTPRRDLAPNLFVVNVDVKPPVTRVEFFVEGKKIFTKNAPPYVAELDLGSLPRRVEVRAVGYDKSGRYIDADAWLVNERETPLEVKITRTTTADGISHFKVSVQNQQNVGLKSVELFAGDKKLAAWSHPPYAIDLPTARLQGFDFVRATALNDNNVEATDLLYLNGERYTESIEVNLVELPVTVSDASGAVVTSLQKDDFQVFEDSKAQKISNFAFANNLPLSVGVLVDHSGSMKPRITDARNAALQFFKQILGNRDRGFFGGFSWQTTKLSPLVSDLASLQEQVQSMPDADGGTALYDAIVTALYQFRGVEGRKALVIVTDGEDTASRVPYDEMLKYVRSARVPLYFIGIDMGPFGGNSKMKSLAAETGGVAYFVKKVDELGETYKKLEADLRSQYLISYYTEAGGKDSKYRTVEVKTKKAGLKVRTIRGFIP